MRKLRIVPILLFLLAMFAVPAFAAEYNDVARDQWYYTSVRSAYEQGLMDGETENTFNPNGDMTRACFISSLGKAAGQQSEDYSAWAVEHRITDGSKPDQPITRQEMAVMLARAMGLENKQAGEKDVPVIKDAAQVSDWALSSVNEILALGLMTLDHEGNFYPRQVATRAEAAAVLSRLNLPSVRAWTDAAVTYTVPAPKQKLVEESEIIRVALEAELDPRSNGFRALLKINEYELETEGPLLFLFEGAGNYLYPEMRMGAMAVIVRDGQIVYYNRNCSTIPDQTVNPARNGGRAIPTMISGIYDFKSWNHQDSQIFCPALTIINDRVIRFENGKWAESTSGNINIHRRYDDWNLVNSNGCLIIGRAGENPEDEYAAFAVAIGILEAGKPSNEPADHAVSGQVIIDRSLAKEYLKAVGYSDEAIQLLG